MLDVLQVGINIMNSQCISLYIYDNDTRKRTQLLSRIWNYYEFQVHARAPGAWLQASMICKKSGFKAAPPTRNPSMFGWEISSAAFLAPTEPPYYILML
jgi:hypothetical protein